MINEKTYIIEIKSDVIKKLKQECLDSHLNDKEFFGLFTGKVLENEREICIECSGVLDNLSSEEKGFISKTGVKNNVSYLKINKNPIKEYIKHNDTVIGSYHTHFNRNELSPGEISPLVEIVPLACVVYSEELSFIREKIEDSHTKKAEIFSKIKPEDFSITLHAGFQVGSSLYTPRIVPESLEIKYDNNKKDELLKLYHEILIR